MLADSSPTAGNRNTVQFTIAKSHDWRQRRIDRSESEGAIPRGKRKNRPLCAAQIYLGKHLPELRNMPLRLQLLDGPPDSPRYAVTIEACTATVCPHGFRAQTDSSRQCGVLDCPLRRSARLLLDNQGVVIHATISGIHWN
ncbi:MAG TPA: hypothetical protein VFO07_09035 [Roseiflexaceae bacterium]|nr:hypothetical protein [Roseiflexaceae bacterium]